MEQGPGPAQPGCSDQCQPAGARDCHRREAPPHSGLPGRGGRGPLAPLPPTPSSPKCAQCTGLAEVTMGTLGAQTLDLPEVSGQGGEEQPARQSGHTHTSVGSGAHTRTRASAHPRVSALPSPLSHSPRRTQARCIAGLCVGGSRGSRGPWRSGHSGPALQRDQLQPDPQRPPHRRRRQGPWRAAETPPASRSG